MGTVSRIERSFGAPVARAGRAALAASGGLGGVLVLGPSIANAHGTVVLPEPGPAEILLGWSFDPPVALPLLVAAFAYVWAVRRVNLAHPANRVPIARPVAFLGGLAAIAIALQSGIERYDTTLFSIHMVQHILLTLVAAPLIALGAPITLVLRLASHGQRRGFLLPVLHSRVLRVMAHPVVAWLLFTAVMWGSHFSPLFNSSLEDPLVHDLEHLAFLGAGLLFWWPAIGLDPGPWRLSHPVRMVYVFLQMPQNTFLSLAIFSAGVPLYEHYATLVRPWGPTPLADQQLAGGLMWVGGDVIFLVALLGLVVAWMRREERDTARTDARADAQRAQLHERSEALAARRATDAADRTGPLDHGAG
jgi:putative copper resistance protein D